MKSKSSYFVKPGAKVRLSSFRTDDHGEFRDKAAAEKAIERSRKQLEKLQEVFYASEAKALLIVLQGMDTAGKDGTIRSIFTGINPQGCQVASFKVPTALEARHDFLWRCHAQAPARGMIGIFNRSHYEDVLSPVVHGKMSEKTAREHLEDINAWEKTLANNDTVVLKFFLHISHEEQTRRLQARIDTPDKHWKLSPADFAERKFWDAYEERYEEILRHTSHKHAPWFVIPADHKWYRDVAISSILVEAMQSLKLSYPAPSFDPSGVKLDANSPDGEAEKGSKKDRKRKNGKEAKKSASSAGKDGHGKAARLAEDGEPAASPKPVVAS